MENMELGLTEKRNRTSQDNAPTCSKGWEHRCANGKNTKCTCKCGGRNHGKKKHQTAIHDPRMSPLKNEIINLGFSHEVFYYKGFGNCESMCSLNINKSGARTIVILSELPDNHGTSITNFFEELATQIYKKRLSDVSAEDVIWIEHYPAKSNRAACSKTEEEETFDMVYLGWVNGRYITPQWSRIKNIEEIIKKAL